MARSLGYGRSRWTDRASVDLAHEADDRVAAEEAWELELLDLADDGDALELLDDLRYGAWVAR
jgi:hypothetical protein